MVFVFVVARIKQFYADAELCFLVDVGFWSDLLTLLWGTCTHKRDS